jgi:integrase
MPVIRFNDISLRSLKEGLYFDERTPAFGIRIGKHRKTWLVLKEPNRTKLRIGHYPALSLSDARKKALVALGSPLGDSHAPAFPEARQHYLDQGQWRPRPRYEMTRTLNRYFHWTKPIDKITHRDVAEAIDPIEAKSEAAHAFKNLRAFFNWCVPRYLKYSPCSGLKPPARYFPRSRVLSDNELRNVWHATGDNVYGTTIRLLTLMGQRLGETSAIRKEWLDGTTLTIPAPFTKNGREHRIPVPQTAIPLIEKLRPFKSWGDGKAQLDKASGVSSYTHHDLRRTYATNLQRLGIRLEVIETLLNHVSGTKAGIVGTYQRHDYWEEMKQAVDTYEQFLLTLLAR